MIYDYPNFKWIHRNIITDSYKNEDDDKYEYEQRKGVQQEISLEDEVEIHEPLKYKYAIQEIGGVE